MKTLLKKCRRYAGQMITYVKYPKVIPNLILKQIENIPKGRLWEQFDFDRQGRKSPELMWKVFSQSPIRRTEGTVIHLKDKIFICGGFESIDRVLNNMSVLDLNSGKWISHFKMPPEMPETHLGATCDGERYIYFAGGQKGPQCHPAVAHCFVLDTHDYSWKNFPPLPEARYAPTIQIWRGRLHVLGGSKEDRNTPSCDHWSIAIIEGTAIDQTWRKEFPIPRGGPHRASAVINDKLYLFGGEEGDVKAYAGDPEFKCDWNTPQEIVYGDSFVLEHGSVSWEKLSPMPYPVSHTEFSITPINHLVILAGGNHGRSKLSNNIQVFNTQNNSWLATDRLPYPMKTATAYHQGWLYLINGQCSKSSRDLRPGRVLNTVWRARLSK